MLFLFFLFLIDVKQKEKMNYIHTLPKIICVIAYICFWGMRGFIGTDYSWYYPYFNNLSDRLLYAFDDIERIEPGYVIYTYIFKQIWDNYYAFIFFSTCLNVAFMHVLFKNLLKRYYIFGYIVFIAFCANAEFNNLRNIRAICTFSHFIISFPSIESIIKKDWKSFLALNLLGMSFHSTAIFYLPFYFIINRNWKRIILPLIFIGFIFVILKLNVFTKLILFTGQMLGGVYEASAVLFTDNNEDVGFTLGAIMRLLLGFFLWLSYDRIKEPLYRIYINLAVCYLFCFAFFNEIPVFRLRFSLMFAFSLCIILPYVYIIIQKKYRRFFLLFAFLSCMSQALVNFQGDLFRYDNLLFGIESYERRLNK